MFHKKIKLIVIYLNRLLEEFHDLFFCSRWGTLPNVRWCQPLGHVEPGMASQVCIHFLILTTLWLL